MIDTKTPFTTVPQHTPSKPLKGGSTYECAIDASCIESLDRLYNALYGIRKPETHTDAYGREVDSKTLLPVDSDAPKELSIKGTF